MNLPNLGNAPFQLNTTARHGLFNQGELAQLTLGSFGRGPFEVFKAQGAGYQSRINAVLSTAVEQNLTAGSSATTRKRVAT
jgi:hypothetical protein